MYRGIVCLILVFAALAPGQCLGRTIQVAADGTGEFEVLQAGLDAAAEGDTVRIGPGRYDDFFAQVPATGLESRVIGFISTANLTVLGEDRATVLIGPHSPTSDIDGKGTRCLYVDSGAVGVEILNLTVEHTGILIGDLEGCQMRSVTFQNPTVSGYGGRWLNRVVFQDCSFRGIPHAGVFWSSVSERPDLLVEDCDFQSCLLPISVQMAGDVAIRRSSFEGSHTALTLLEVTSGVVQDCVFRESSDSHMSVRANSNVDLSNSVFSPGSWHALYLGAGTLRATGCRFGGGSSATISVIDSVLDVHECEVLNGGGLSVRSRVSDVFVQAEFVDMRDNWWGTADAGQIAEWIDDSGASMIPVSFEPYHGRRVGTDSTTVGALKLRYAPH